MLGLLALALLAPAARASAGEATHNLRGAAGPRPPARVVAPVFPWPPDGSEPDCRDEGAWASSEGLNCNEVARDAAALITNAAPHANADVRAVRIVRRRRDVVLRHEGLQHLRLRRPQTQTVQSQEHGRSENSTRGLPCHLLNVLIPYPLSQVTRRHHRKLIGATTGQQLQEPLVHGVLELDEAPVLPQRAGDGGRRGDRQRQPRGPDDLAQREGHG